MNQAQLTRIRNENWGGWNRGLPNPFAKNLPQTFKEGHIPWNKGLKGYNKNHPKYGGIKKGFKYPENHPLRKKMSLIQKGKKLGIDNPFYGKHHTDESKIKIGDACRGAKSWRWVGGTNAYRGEDWEQQRLKCLKRDNYTCRKCKRTDFIGAHHIIPYRKSKDNSLSNLITLCPRCHTKMENDYRRVGMTHFLEKLIEENKQIVVRI